MKKIKDERLVLKNLQNIRIAYLVQTLGILIILFFNFYQGGFDAVRNNPLFMLLLITSVVSAFLSMSITAEMENTKQHKNIKRHYIVSIVIILIISIVFGYFVSISEDSDLTAGFVIGSIIFICSFIPATYIYRLRKKAQMEWEE